MSRKQWKIFQNAEVRFCSFESFPKPLALKFSAKCSRQKFMLLDRSEFSIHSVIKGYFFIVQWSELNSQKIVTAKTLRALGL